MIPLAPMVLAAVASATVPGAPARNCPVLVRWDAATGRRTVVHHGRETPLRKGPLRLSTDWCLEVRGISTGLQAVTFTETPYDTTGVAGLELLAEKLKPMAPAPVRLAMPGVLVAVKDRVAALKMRGERGDDPAVQLRVALQKAIDEVQQLVDGPNGIAPTRTQALLALDRMAGHPEESEQIAAELRERIGDRLACEPGTDPCRTALKARLSLADAFRRVESARAALEKVFKPRGPELTADQNAAADQGAELLKDARTTMSTYPEVSNAAREAEHLVVLAVEARSVVVQGPMPARFGRGVVVRAAVEPRSEPDLANLAPRTGATLELRAEHDSPFRISVAPVGLLVAGPKTNRYGNKGGVVTVTGRSDVSLQFGVAVSFLSLSLLPEHDVFLQGPDLIALPAGSATPAGGLGISATWGPVKLGVGAIWLREDQLAAGTKPGDPIAAGDTVRVDRGYPSKPRFAFVAGGNL